ncbi:MAG: folylpolyglutamate synthase/dihydrofolate synthase family protein [Deltaproteobacteria bacterium]
MSYATDYLNSLGLNKIKPGLGRINKLLKRLGSPEGKVPGVIIAGTNGKGSVASAISSVLSAQGYSTGLYTSPHLINITERIQINGKEISPPELDEIIIRVKEAAESSLGEDPSYFEVLTASAFLYFAEKGVDYNVLEVGMGGRWDATNVITPLVSVITNITKDHTEFLGNTISDIAKEKACIIKKQVPVITAAKGRALHVILKTAADNSSPVSVYGRDFISAGESPGNFTYRGPLWELTRIKSNLTGLYQIENLSVALSALEALSQHSGIQIDEKALRRGLSGISWNGRLEILRKDPLIVLDSAHNEGGAKALVKSLEQMFPGTKFTFLVGMLSDKNHASFFREISQIANELLITDVPSERRMEAGKLSKIASKYLSCNIRVIEDYRKSFEEIMRMNGHSCIAGSIYLTGAVKALHR